MRRYILARQVEVLASCLVEALIIAAAKPNRQGQQSSYVWEALSTAATARCRGGGVNGGGGGESGGRGGRILNGKGEGGGRGRTVAGGVGLAMTPGGVVGKECHLSYSEGDC